MLQTALLRNTRINVTSSQLEIMETNDGLSFSYNSVLVWLEPLLTRALHHGEEGLCSF